MKLEVGNKVYVQKRDVAYIMYRLSVIPTSIVDELKSNGPFYMSGAEDGNWFDMAFEQADNVKWLMRQDWILNYAECSKLPLRKLKAIKRQLLKDYAAEKALLKAKNANRAKWRRKTTSDELSKLDHKITALSILIKAREGELELILPPGVRMESSTKHTKNTGRKLGIFGVFLHKSAR